MIFKNNTRVPNLSKIIQQIRVSDSEEDFFLPTQLSPPKKGVSDSTVGAKVSVVEYFFLVTFDWNLMEGNPFQMSVLEVIKDFPEEWIRGPLTKNCRLEKVAISVFGGGNYSLFCKVEKGGIIYIYICRSFL